MPGDERTLLRHTLATLAYRSRKVLLDVPPGFAAFQASEASRSAGQILAHMGDLFDWALSIADGRQAWKDEAPLPWEEEVLRFYAALRRFDDRLADPAELKAPAASLFQGPVADALTHLGQIALIRRLAQSPVKAENYYRAEIVAGRIEPGTQAAPRREF
ncbi:MAG TPA: hypothetical protein PLD86_12330 [Vicinamibacteria bacterium]|nr:hypothetical protein [Vicinamibacteria bacterium]